MKVAQINSVYKFGSTGRIVSEIHERLLDLDIESKVFYGRGSRYNNKNLIKISNNISVFIDFLMTRLLNKHGEANIVNTRRLIKFLKEFQPDVVQIHNIHGYYLNYEILFNYLEESETPVIWLMHDRWAMSGGSAFYDPELVDWESTDTSQLRHLSNYYPKYLFFSKKSALKNYTKKKATFPINNLSIITPSKWLYKVCKESFFINTELQVINNGIDLNIFKPEVIERKKQKILLGVASQWDENKGLNYFNKLAETLDNNYKIILIGIDGKTKNKMNEKITCIKRTNNIQELVKYYSLADIFINPTLDDTFPTVNLEAQACGTPVITFETGGSPESIIEGETGKIIEKNNFHDLKKSIEEWPRKNLAIITKCRENSLNYNKDQVINTYIELYFKKTNSILK